MISRSVVLSACVSVLSVACSGADGQGAGPPAPPGESSGAPTAVGPSGSSTPTGAGGGSVAPPTTSVGTSSPPPPIGAGGAPPAGGPGSVPGSGGQSPGGAPGAGGSIGASGGAAPAAETGGAGTGGAPAVDPPGTAVLTSGTFTVQPGGETFQCQNFDNPFGKDTVINRISSDMTKGSHHLHVYNLTEGTSKTIGPCSGGDFHPLVHGSGRPHDDTIYGDGMGMKIHGSSGFRIQLHYLNTGTDPLQGGATIKMYPVADVSQINKWVAAIYLNRLGLTVPPGQGQQVSTTCSIPSVYGQIGLVYGVSHMHSRGVRFVAKTSTGTVLTDDTTWEEPTPRIYDPAVMLNPGDSINWTCTYDNDTGKTLTFGDSAATNEMCIFIGRYYSSNANDLQLTCMSPSTNGGAAQPQSM